MNKILLLLLFASYNLIGQSKHTESGDSLLKKSFKFLSEKAKNPDVNKESRNSYGIAWLTKSKLEQNWSETANAYHTIIFFKIKKNFHPTLIVCFSQLKKPKIQLQLVQHI